VHFRRIVWKSVRYRRCAYSLHASVGSAHSHDHADRRFGDASPESYARCAARNDQGTRSLAVRGQGRLGAEKPSPIR